MQRPLRKNPLTRFADSRLAQQDHFDRLEGVLIGEAEAPTDRRTVSLLGGRQRRTITVHVFIGTDPSVGCPIDYEPLRMVRWYLMDALFIAICRALLRRVDA